MVTRYMIKERKTGKFFCNIWKNNWLLVDGKPVQQSEFDWNGECFSYDDAASIIKQLTTVSKQSPVIYPKYFEDDLELIELCEKGSSDAAEKLEDWFNRFICLYAGTGNSNMTNAYFSGKPVINEVMMLLTGRGLQ